MSQQKALLLASQTAGAFTLGTRAIPEPGPGQVLVKNITVAVNPVDFYIKTYGIFVSEFGFPAVAGCDGAGTIAKLGEGVTGWKIGDEILYQSFWHPDRGTFQEYTLVDAVRVARKPSNLSFEQAATVPLGFSTAAFGMYGAPPVPGKRDAGASLTEPWTDEGRGKYAGQPTLIIGGSGSVGQFAIQLAKLSGFSPIITTASGHNAEYCKAAGATHVIDYHETPYEKLPEAILKITSKPITYIYDAVSVGETQETAWKILAPGGTVTLVGEPKVGKTNDVGEDGKRTAWVYAVIHAGPNTELATRMYSVLTGLLERGELKPNNVEVLEKGLAGVLDVGVDRAVKGVSGVKLVARVAETP